MKKRTILILAGVIAILVFAQGCMTAGRSMGAGSGAGAALGAGVGALADPGRSGENRIRNILIGTAVGGAVGAGTGYITHRLVKNEKDESYNKGKDEAKKDLLDQAQRSEGAPRLLPPKTEARWVPDQIRGSTFIPGHFEYDIVERARWELNR